MTRMMKCVLFALILSALSRAEAQTINAASCNEADVSSALSSVTADGATVVIPSCPAGVGWSTALNYTVTHSVSVIGAGNSSVGGGDQTVIIDNVNHATTDYAVQISTTAGKAFRWSGITIKAGTGGTSNNGVFQLAGNGQSVRFDHNHFLNNNQLCLDVGGQIYGVADHNLFDCADLGVRALGVNWDGGSGWGDNSWSDPTHPGSGNVFFFENNTFNTSGPADDCLSGGRLVVRFNTFNAGNSSLQTHPTGHAGRDRGCRSNEIYNNLFNGNPNCATNFSTCAFNIMFMSSGTLLLFDNNCPVVNAGSGCGWQWLLTLHSMRRDNGTYSQTATPNGWGYCGTSFNGTGSNWDQNTNASNGYPCADQPGRGQGNLLSNADFPKTTNNSTGVVSYVNDALEPVYEWGDIFTQVPQNPGGLVNNYNSDVLVANQDYYLGTASFTGASGVGTGTLASRPSTCTTGVAYWATDQGSWNQSGTGGQGTLYTCTASNTWTLYYTPYTYPHPLTTSTATAPAAPNSLQDVVK
jgi:hypothetical protein